MFSDISWKIKLFVTIEHKKINKRFIAKEFKKFLKIEADRKLNSPH